MKSSTVVDFILISIIVLLLEINNCARVLLELWSSLVTFVFISMMVDGGRPLFCGIELEEVRRCGNHKKKDHKEEAELCKTKQKQ